MTQIIETNKQTRASNPYIYIYIYILTEINQTFKELSSNQNSYIKFTQSNHARFLLILQTIKAYE